MSIVNSSQFCAALLALLALTLLPGVSLADDDNKKKDSKSETKKEKHKPDLKIEFLGFYSPQNTQLVKFKVTNIGRERSPETVALGETLRPEPRQVEGMKVPGLEPGKSVEILYPLAAPCDGHEVKATVTIPDDDDLDNNTDQATACDEKPQGPPSQPSTSAGGVVLAPKTDNTSAPPADGLIRTAPTNTDLALLPPHLQSGAHPNYSVELSRSLSIGVRKVSGICPAGTLSVPELTVGFTRNDASGLCQFNGVYQTALAFDLARLREAHERAAIVEKATLSWKDEMHESGLEEMITGSPTSCVSTLAVPIDDWAAQDIKDLIPNEYLAGGGMSDRSNGWEITSLVRTWLAQPIAASRGVLLRGFDESFEDGENDEADCYSRLRDITLVVDYVIPNPR
jgi:hypothetical protein